MLQPQRRIQRIRPLTSIVARTSAIGMDPPGSEETRRADTSRQIYEEDFFSSPDINSLKVVPLQPPYNPVRLMMIAEQSNMIPQCVTAYVTNIALCGLEVAPVNKLIPMDPNEVEELQSYIDHANSDESLATVRGKIVWDVETIGYGFEEIIRDRAGRVGLSRHVRAHTMRLCAKGDDYFPVKYDIRRGPRVVKVTELKQFRRFVQMVNGTSRYFKEFGDKRRMDYSTGAYQSESYPVPDDKLATEIIHYKNGADTYGVPRWINQLPSILGSRESEEVNLRYFEDNTIPPIIMSVAGGRLTAQSFADLQKMLLQQSIGRDRQHKIILVEAVPERESLDDKGTVQLKIDKLSDSRQSDGLFKDYDEGNQSKVRSSFRLPPVAVGLSQDVTFATANVSSWLVESQVYAPERKKYDEVSNNLIVGGERGLRLQTVVLKAKVPPITNSQELIKSLTALNVMGALTPRTALEAANRILEIELPLYPAKGGEDYGEWMDRPILFVTKGSNTQDEQGRKTNEMKKDEKSGNVAANNPENGDE